MKRVTIKDIAKELHLSVSTVSRAFNDKYDIRSETREIVLRTAEKLGYRPNPIARKLIQQRSYNIGIVVPEFVNSYFPEVIIGAQEVLLDKGYQVLIMQSNESAEIELKNVQTLVDNMVDGLIVSLASEAHNLDIYKELIESRMPLVFFNRVVEDLSVSKVLFDDFKWAFFATEHLLAQGYMDIVHLSGPEHLTLSKNRIRGFEGAHRKHKVEIGKIIPCGFTIQDAEKKALELINRNEIPQAIFAANDHMAIGAMKVFKENGYRIPNDIAFVGFSESRLAQYVEPPLTSVKQPTFEMGRTTAELLLEQINNNDSYSPQSVVVGGKLNIRESSLNKSSKASQEDT